MPPSNRARPLVELLEPRDVPTAFQDLPVLPTADTGVLDHARAIADRGRQLGRRTDVFLKIGDSNSADPAYLTALGQPGFNPFGSGLAAVAPQVLDTLAAFRAPVDRSGFNSFNQPRRIVFGGGYLPTLLPRLDEEVAATNAGIALILVGTNDATLTDDPEGFRTRLTFLVRSLAEKGVVPVLTTIPDNRLQNGVYQPDVLRFNQVIADVGGRERVPVYNLWRTLSALPFQGLSTDNLHLNSTAGGGRFVGTDLLFAQNVRNLQSLEILDWYRERVVAGSPEVPPQSGWTPLAVESNVYAVGRGAGQAAVVTVHDIATGRVVNQLLTFDPAFTGGVRVAVGDVTGDGVPDIVAGAGPGGGPAVKVFDGMTGGEVASVFAYEPGFRNGVGSLAVADLDGDGAAEVVVGAGAGGGPVVAVYHGRDFAEAGRFFAYEPEFRGGVNVTAGTFAGVGAGIATGAGAGGGSAVHLFAFGSDTPAVSFFAFDPGEAGGVVVAAGDLDGDGLAELATAPATDAPRIRVFDPTTGAERASYFATEPGGPGGVTLAVRAGRVLVGNPVGRAVGVRAFPGLTSDPEFISPDEPIRAYGVYVG